MACVDLSLSLIVQNMWQLKVSVPLYSLFSVSPNPQSEDVAEMAFENISSGSFICCRGCIECGWRDQKCAQRH